MRKKDKFDQDLYRAMENHVIKKLFLQNMVKRIEKERSKNDRRMVQETQCQDKQRAPLADGEKD